MSMSLLMVVQPLLDAGRNMASTAGSKSQGNDAGNPFQALLKGQITAREPEKQIVSQPADSKEAAKQPTSANENAEAKAEAKPAESTESAKEGKAAEESAPGKEETASAEDAAILAQIMAAALGAQIVPVEPVPANDVAEIADESGSLLLAVDEESASGRKMQAASDIELAVTGKGGVKEGVDEAAYGKVQADAEQNATVEVGDKPAETDKPVVTAASANKPAAAQTAEIKLASEQPVAQAQQPVPTISTQQVAQAQAAPLAAQVDPAASRVMQQMGTPEWNQAIGQRVMWMVGQEQQSASLTLNPPDLGPVRVVVSVANNNATANFFSSNPEVRQALEGSLPRLREMMEGAGIQLGQAQVGAENSGNQQPQQASSGNRTTRGAGGDSDIGSLTAVTGAPASGQMISRGLVDTFA